MQKYIIYRGTNTYNLYYKSCVFGELLIKEYELNTPIIKVYNDIKKNVYDNNITEQVKVILNI